VAMGDSTQATESAKKASRSIFHRFIFISRLTIPVIAVKRPAAFFAPVHENLSNP
jgi:hypothetical protein